MNVILAVVLGLGLSVPSQTNIVLFMADDAGFELFPSYGGESYSLPRITALAEGGMQFNRCYSQPVCSPSRIKIMTGRYNFRNYSDWGALPHGERTFANALRDAGYATGLTGKWQCNPSLGQTPQQAGFGEHLIHHYHSPSGNRYWQPRVWLNEELLPTTPEDYGPALFREFARNFITEHQHEPFLLYFPMALPHVETDGEWVPTPDSEDGAQGIELFIDMIEYMDNSVGEIVDHLDSLDLLDNTIVMFTADNGTLGRVVSQWNGRSIQGGKFKPTDIGTRVPLIVNGPGFETGQTDALVSFADFKPTLAAIGGGLPGETDGVNFFENVREYTYNWMNWRGYQESHTPVWRFVTDGTWKLFDDNRLFNIVTDLEEQSPDYLGNQDKRRELQAEMDRIEADLPGASADLNADLTVNTDDLLILLSNWGPCGHICPGNLNADDVVDLGDMLILLSNWSRP